MVALGVTLMALGTMPMFDLTACALASLLVAFVYIEIGSPYTYLVWICTTLITLLIFPGHVIWIEYFLAFGIYPILKAYIERLPRAFWLIIKLVYTNAVIWLLFLGSEFIIGEDFFGTDKLWMKVLIYALVNLAFVLYDLFITVLIRFYFDRLRPRFKNLLK